MTFKTQKILIVTGMLLFVIAVSIALYFTFFRVDQGPEVTSPAITEDVPATGTLPGGEQAGERIPFVPEIPGALPTDTPTPVAIGGTTQVTALTLTGISSPQLSPDGQSLNFYDPADGKFYAVNKDGDKVSLLPDSYLNVDDITWNNNGTSAILEFPDGANITLDFKTGDTHTLPQHWEDFDFSPDGNQIALKSIGVDPGNRWLVIASPDGSSAQTVAALGSNQDKVDVSWSPNNQVVAFSDTGALISGFGRKQILPIGKNKENFPGLIVEGFSFEPLWSKDGARLLYSTNGPYSNYLPQLWLVDAQSDTMGSNRRSVPLNTWADKCTYSTNSTVYCAVPQHLPEGSGLQRQLAFGEPDTIYKIDTNTGVTSLIGTPESPTSMTNLVASDDGKTLYYQNELSGTLQQMQVK